MAGTSPLSRSRPKPSNRTGVFASLMRNLAALMLAVTGWKLEGDWPQDAEKAVLVAAPHTSNWDGLWMIFAAAYYRVKLRWMGKKSLVDHPLGWFVKWLGCVPVDRKSASDIVEQTAAAFAESDRLTLAVAPEGTRSAMTEWKSGFYRIAIKAGVPLIITVLDYGTRTVKIAGLFQPTGDYQADLPLIKAYYANAEGRHKGNFSLNAGED
ncbi:1-acyl-sn-glycerol-3-phosphate acyltransferase [Henriciella sp. AS95]|uniref:1-acyl-sn-glycerol-3-phosphate acyltransferase n=1 Tax=Henriciella sp. AS95 TaxID=3135782 RepID=UPI00317CD5D0